MLLGLSELLELLALLGCQGCVDIIVVRGCQVILLLSGLLGCLLVVMVFREFNFLVFKDYYGDQCCSNAARVIRVIRVY